MTILTPCVDAFILTILCGSPIKGAFLTTINGTILALDQKIVELTLQLGRLNVLNRVLSFELQTVQAITNKVSADLNLVLEPFQQFASCAPIQKMNDVLQDNAVTKALASTQNLIAEVNEMTNLAKLQDASIKYWQQRRDELQAFVNRVNELCP